MRQRRVEEARELLVAQRQRRQVQREQHVRPEQLRLACITVEQRRDDPGIDPGRQAVAFGGRQEFGGRAQHVAVPVTQQHLDVARGGRVLQRPCRLHEKFEAILQQRGIDARHPLNLAAPALHGLVARVVDVDAIAPVFLGEVTGRVDVPHHVGHLFAGLVDRHEADARADREHVLFPAEAVVRDPFADLGRDTRRLLQRAMLHQDAEFVTAEPRDRVAPAHRVLQQQRNLPQQLVARAVTAGVVDDLELVEIEIAQRVAVAGRGCVADYAHETAFELDAVDEARQAVVRGLVGHRLGHAPFLGDVAQDHHSPVDLVAIVADWRCGVLDRMLAAVRSEQQGVTARIDTALLQALPDRIADRFAAAFAHDAHDVVQRPAQRLGLAQAQQFLRRAVQHLDATLGVGGDDGVTDGSQGDQGLLALGLEGEFSLLARVHVLHGARHADRPAIFVPLGNAA